MLEQTKSRKLIFIRYSGRLSHNLITLKAQLMELPILVAKLASS